MTDQPEGIRPRPRPDPVPRPSPRRTSRARRRVAARAGQMIALLCVAAGVAVFVVARTTGSSEAKTRPSAAASSSSSAPVANDRALLTDPSTAQSFLAAAVSEIVIVSDSDYRNLDNALSAGLSVTTGAFQTRFRDALTGASAQARQANRSTTSIDVLQAGIGQITDSGKQAKVLVFGRLHQTGDDVDSASSDTVVTLCLTLVRSGAQYLISDLEQGANAGLPPGTTGLSAAAEAARSEVISTLSYSRSNFDADLSRAQAGAVGSLKTQLTADAASLQSALTKGNYDSSGAVTSIAAQQVAGDAAVFLVAASKTQTPDTGLASAPSYLRYIVNTERVSGTWLVSAVTPVS